MEQMHEISFEHIDDGSIRLEQQSGIEEPNVIWLHPEQLRYISRQMCGVKSSTESAVEDLARKLSEVTSRLERLVAFLDTPPSAKAEHEKGDIETARGPIDEIKNTASIPECKAADHNEEGEEHE